MAVGDPVCRSPVRLEAELEAGTSRWLWLVKWLLLFPHFVVLAFLWLSLWVTTVMAFFSILFTGRYPRALFDFNVGVLRWTWRVSCYGYGILGTDRYPPFSLKDDATYPAHFDVDPPERLSRGLVLVKWWLLAIPHYLVLSVFLGGATYAATEDAYVKVPRPGLIALLVVIAGAHLLFTGRYPERLFALLVGLNRWVFRVWAYAGLMTDRYPPFELDQGGVLSTANDGAGHEDAPTGSTATGSPPADHPSAQRGSSHRSGWTAGRVLSLVVGCVFVVTGTGFLVASGAVAWLDHGARDGDGFVTSRSTTVATSGRAITSGRVLLRSEVPEDFLANRIVGDLRLSVDPRTSGDLFVGVGPSDEVNRYLAGVARDTVTGLDDGRPVYRRHVGTSVPSAPGEQTFWTVQGTGDARLHLTWEPSEGDWTYVLMNADASPVLAADVKIGAELPVLDALTVGLVVSSVVLLVAGAVLIAVPVRRASRRQW